MYMQPGADPFGFPTLKRPWDDGSESLANAKRRMRAGFEFFQKLGVNYWTFHDRYVCSAACVSIQAIPNCTATFEMVRLLNILSS